MYDIVLDTYVFIYIQCVLYIISWSGAIIAPPGRLSQDHSLIYYRLWSNVLMRLQGYIRCLLFSVTSSYWISKYGK